MGYFKFHIYVTYFSIWGIGSVIVMVFIGIIIASTACTSVYIQYVIIRRLRGGENPHEVDNRLRNDLIPPQAQRSDAPIAAVHQTSRQWLRLYRYLHGTSRSKSYGTFKSMKIYRVDKFGFSLLSLGSAPLLFRIDFRKNTLKKYFYLRD